MRYSFLLLFAFLLLSNTSHAFRAKPWQILRTSGDVSVQRGEEILKVSRTPFQLESGDIVITESRSKARIRRENSSFYIGPKSQTRIEFNKSENPKTKSERGIIDVIYGKLRAEVKKDTASKYKIKAKAAVAGVRGTELFVHVIGGEVQLCTIEGLVEVELEDGSKKEVPGGMGVTLKNGQPLIYRETPMASLAAWLRETSFEEEPQMMMATKYAPRSNWMTLSDDFRLYHRFGYRAQFRDQTVKAITDTEYVKNNIYEGSFFYGLKQGIDYGVQIEASLNSIAQAERQTIDGFAGFNETSYSRIALREALAYYVDGPFELKLGIQSNHVDSKVILPRQFYFPEEDRHLGLEISYDIDSMNRLRFFISEGLEDTNAFDHLTQTSVYGVNYTGPEKYGSLTLVFTSEKNENLQGMSALAYRNLISYSDLAFEGEWVYQILDQNTPTNKESSHETFLDLNLSYAFHLGILGRIDLGFTHASENFKGLFEDQYRAGISGTYSRFSNLNITSMGLSLSPLLNHFAEISYYMINDVTDSGSIIRTDATTNKVGSELNISYIYKYSNFVEASLHGFWFKGDNLFEKNDGFLIRLEFK